MKELKLIKEDVVVKLEKGNEIVCQLTKQPDVNIQFNAVVVQGGAGKPQVENKSATYDANGTYTIKADPGTYMEQVNVKVEIYDLDTKYF